MTLLYRSNGAPAYSAASGTTIAVPVPPSLSIGDLVVLKVHQKPSTANGGTCTTPTNFTRGTDITGAGGYGSTLAADSGNTNIYTFWKVIDGTEAWLGPGATTLTVTVGTNNVAWGQMSRYTAGSGQYDVAMATGSDTTTGAAVSVTFGSNPGVTAGDLIEVVFGIPTDVTTPAQFSSEALSQTGVTFGTVTEVAEADSTNGNGIGGVIVRSSVSSGTGSANPVFTATAGGTTANVMGPAVFIRTREANPVAITNPGTSVDVSGDYIQLPVRTHATSGSATHTVYGWAYIPDAGASTSPGRIFASSSDLLRLVWDTPYNAWRFIGNDNTDSSHLFGRKGWVFVAVVYTATQATIYWRRPGQYELGRRTETFTNTDSNTSFFLGEAGGEYQYWGYVEGALTEAQLLAQSQSTTQLVAGRSFWTLISGSTTDSVSAQSATFNGCQSGARTAPASAVGTPNAAYATQIGERTSPTAGQGTVVYLDASPVSPTTGFTLSAWVRLPNTQINAYLASLATDDLATAVMVYVIELKNAGTTDFWSNLMSTVNGDTSVRTVSGLTNAQATGWVFIAWSQANTGTNIVTSTYSAFGPGDTLTLRGAAEAMPTPEVHNASMHLRLNVGNSAAVGYNVRHLRLHNSALSQSQLAALMLSDTADTTAWAHYPLDDSSLRDVSGNGRHAHMLRDDGFRGLAGPSLPAAQSTFLGALHARAVGRFVR